jgi:hypothetical protein
MKVIACLSLVFFATAPVLAEETESTDSGGDSGITETILNEDSYVEEVVLNEDTPAEVEEVSEDAMVVTDAASSGAISLVRDGGYLEVKSSGVLVERLAVSNDAACEVAQGQVGRVDLCTGVDAKLYLAERPPFTCPSSGASTFGPCRVDANGS